MPTSFYDDPWSTWATATLTNTSVGTTWIQWVDSTCTTATTTATTNGVFRIWLANESTATWTTVSGNAGNDCRTVQPYRRTPEQEAEDRRREQEYRERKRVEAERYRAAKERAEGLLYEHLSDTQRAQLKRDKFFVVLGGKSGKRYRINAAGGVSGNVEEIDDSGPVRRLCAHIDHAANAPVFDHLLAQKLMLEHQEDAFLRVANTHWRRDR